MTKQAKRSDNITVRWVVPNPPPTAEQVEEARQALYKFVRALARRAAREDFEREKKVAESKQKNLFKDDNSKSRDWIWL